MGSKFELEKDSLSPEQAKQLNEELFKMLNPEEDVPKKPKPRPTEDLFEKLKSDSIVLNDCEKKLLKCLLISELLLTLLSFGVTIISIFRESKWLAMGRTSYWWYFIFCLLIFVSVYQAINAINKSKDNTEDFTCFLVLTLIILVIDLIIFSQFFFVQYPPNGDPGREVNWEVYIIYLTSISRLLALFIIFGVLVFHLNRYYDRWDVANDYFKTQT